MNIEASPKLLAAATGKTISPAKVISESLDCSVRKYLFVDVEAVFVEVNY